MLLSILFLAAATPVADAPADPVVEALRNATVAGVYEQPVRLVDGVYEGEPFVDGGAARPRLFLVPYLHHEVDLDRDGQDEVVGYLEENSGGSGHFLHAAVFEVQGDSLVSTATLWIGDREQIRRSRVEGRSVVLDLIAHGPRDAGCCPSQLQRRVLSLDSQGAFTERREVQGEATTALLDGTSWRLRSLVYLGPDVDVEVTLNFDGDRVFGTSGCNRFEARFTSSRGRELEIVAPITTRMVCDEASMDVERRVLAALAGVTQWNFLAGHLALLYLDDEGRPFSLVFEAD